MNMGAWPQMRISVSPRILVLQVLEFREILKTVFFIANPIFDAYEAYMVSQRLTNLSRS